MIASPISEAFLDAPPTPQLLTRLPLFMEYAQTRSSSSNVSAEDAARTAEEDGIRIAADIAANVIDADAKAGKDVTGTSVVAAPAETLPPALRVRSEIDVKAGGLAPRAEGCDACALCDDVCGNAACAACVMKQRRVEEEREKRAARGCSKRVYTMCQVRRHQR